MKTSSPKVFTGCLDASAAGTTQAKRHTNHACAHRCFAAQAARQRGRGSERALARERCEADEADAGGGGAEAAGIGGTSEAGAAAGRSFKSGGRGWW